MSTLESLLFRSIVKSTTFLRNLSALLIFGPPGVDVSKDDGVYSGVFMDFVTATCPDCRYNIKVTAEETSWGAEVPVIGNSNSRVLPIMRPTDPIDERINLTQLIGRFKRVVSGGVIQAPLTIPHGDLFPPSRITDLRVIGTSYDEQTVALEWTAPGNDLDRGTADEYDLKYSKNFSVLYKTFMNGTELTNSNLTAGNLSSPQPFGETETVIVQIPDHDENATLFFSVRARDAAGNVGQPSNIVSITVELGRYPDDVVTTTEFPSRMSSVLRVSSAVPQEGLPSRAVSTSLVVGCSLAGVAVVAVLITSLIIIKYKSSKKRKIHNLDAD
ncbi:calcium-activated chloride channel regulator 4A-like [Ptychodera flava]|uniref:calcium-activated chloride channel regulator 4A-like n=1 Tax=Ptychodera flava TaxID=63121 RepID=UPI00396A16BF